MYLIAKTGFQWGIHKLPTHPGAPCHKHQGGPEKARNQSDGTCKTSDISAGHMNDIEAMRRWVSAPTLATLADELHLRPYQLLLEESEESMDKYALLTELLSKLRKAVSWRLRRSSWATWQVEERRPRSTSPRTCIYLPRDASGSFMSNPNHHGSQGGSFPPT